ncbi:MAG: LysM peptidoglycan-binding domain-containing protein, partial [Rhizobacter sp.]|nr:LysM peptidoglycan-binding domain-containing protein [Rhizobacter sp.]
MPLIAVAALRRCLALFAAVGLVAGCSTSPNRAPIEDRSIAPRIAAAASSPAGVAPAAEPATAPVVDSNAGKPGYYTVKAGDTLIRIGLDNGQNWKDLMRWNNLTNPNVIEVGQVIRVVPPGSDPGGAITRPVTTARVETRPLEAKPAAASAPSAASSAPLATVATTAPGPAASRDPAAPREADDDINWAWPTTAPVALPFDDARNKGLVFRGKAGDPVYAAADGRV